MFYGIGINYATEQKLAAEQAEELTTEQLAEATTELPAEATTTAQAEQKTYVVVIDAGHGGNDTGASYHSEEGKINEKTVNLKIAKYMKAALEQYDNVKVIMTRTKNVYMDLDERTDIAVENDADLFISLHNNSLEGAGGYASGSSVCVAIGNAKKELSTESQKLGCNFVYELGELGLKQNGLMMRSAVSYEYKNGKPADYYANIRNPLKHGIIGIIVEHAFIDNADDFYDYLCSKEQLQKLGEADARAVARYLQLPAKDSGEVLASLSDYNVKICRIGQSGKAKKFYRTYYK